MGATLGPKARAGIPHGRGGTLELAFPAISLRYHGVFAPNAKGRSRVVPEREREPGEREGQVLKSPHTPSQSKHEGEQNAPAAEPASAPLMLSFSKHEQGPGAPRYRMPWAELLQKVFAVDLLECPDCGGRLRVVACVTEVAEVKRYLEHVGIDATGPPVAKASAGGGAAGDPLPEYDLVDPIPED